MADRYYNPFQGIDVSVPVEFHDALTFYSQRDSKANIDASPFPRMVDMWFLAVALATRKGIEPADLGKYDTKKIIEGSIFTSDPWRVHTLMLIAIAKTTSVDIVAEPRKVMAIANGLAVAGFPLVLDMLKQGGGEAIWNVSEALSVLIGEKAA